MSSASRSDFWKFWFGQTTSNLGSSVTQFALPLLIFKLTNSALGLGIAFALNMVPYLLFGLIIGAWVDRLDRKRMMIACDVIRALLISVIPVLSITGRLSVIAIYAIGFLNTVVSIFFDSGEFAAIPSLVDKDELVIANGRIQASYSAAQVAGPLVAGAGIAFIPLAMFMLVDAGTFVVSAISLATIRSRFNPDEGEPKPRTTIRADVAEGLKYVLSHPVLRNISAMMALVNFVGSTAWAELIVFSKQRLSASDAQVGMMFSAGSLGIVLLSLSAGRLRKRWPFSVVALGALMLSGALLVAMSLTRSFVAATIMWAAISGLGILFNINTASLRQAIVPAHLLGRIISVAAVLAWSANPLGVLIGGFLIDETQDIRAVYFGIGILTILIPAFFALGPLGHADRYIQAAQHGEAQA